MKGKQVRKLLGRCTSIFKKSIKCMAIFMIAIAVVISSLNVYADSETGVPEYEKDADGNITNIKKIERPPYTYFDDSASLGADKEIRVDTMTDYVPKLFTKWGPIASKVFETSTDSAFHNNSDDSATDWRKYFGPGVSESNEKTDLSKALTSEDHYQHGEYSNDCVLATGIQYATNMDSILHHMTDELAKGLGDRYNTPASTLYDKADLKVIKDTKDKQDTKAFYKIVTSIDNNGATYGYYYNSYALVFYDFELAPIVLKGVTYANQKLTTKESGNTASGAHKTYFKNESESNSNVTTNLTSTSTQSATNSLTSTKTYSFAETIGASASWNTPFLNVAKFTVNFSFTATQAISSAKTESKTIADTYSNSATSSVVLPPHTAIALQQKQDKQTVNIEYDCPVALRYKVAIFSMNGFRYDDRAATDYWMNPKDFVTILGAGNAEGGYGAAENLYVRALDPKTKYKMDRAFGKVEGNHDGRVVRSVVDWASMSDINDKMTTAATQIPMFESGASMDLTNDTTSTEMSKIMPLYPLKAIRIDAPNTSFISGENLSYKNMDYYTVNMSVGDHSYVNYIKLTALNERDIPYHGFIPTKGHWEVVDKEGNPLGNDAPVVLEQNPISKNIEYKAVKEGTCFLKYFIDEDRYATAYYEDEYAKNSDLDKTAALEIVVKDERFKGEVTVDGSYTGIVGDEPKSIDDADGLRVTITDSTDKEVSRPYNWEVKELPSKGISMDGSNVTFTKPGTYHVRAVSGDMQSDWVEVTAVEKKVDVSFKGDFGSEIENQTISYNTAPTLPTSEDMKLPECKQLDGWFLDEEYTKPYEEGTKLKENTTLYANIKHVGITKVERKEPTCTSKGNIEHYRCILCNKLYKDALGTEEITKKDTEIPMLSHTWDGGKYTKYPSKKACGVKTYTCTKCGATRTESIPKLTSKKIKIKGKAKKHKIILGWKSVKGANGYYVYAAKCNTKKCTGKMKKIATLNNGLSKKYVYKKLKKGTYYKLKIKAFKKYGNKPIVIAESPDIHIATKGAKFGNPTKLKLKKKSVKIRVGKKFKIKAKIKSKKKVYYHIAKLRFESQNTSVAKVSKKGKVKGLKKGKTVIYVFTQNCLYKKFKIKVK